MMRRQKANHRTALPASVICVDTETVGKELPGWPGRMCHHLRCGHARYARREGGRWTREVTFDFQTTEEFWGFVLKRLDKRRPLTIYAHSAGFDLTALQVWDQLEEGNYRLLKIEEQGAAKGAVGPGAKGWAGLLVSEDPPTILVVRHKSGAILKVVCTLNWFPFSLKKIGKALGVEKLEMPGDAGDDLDWRAYCRRDCEILELAVRKIYDTVSSADMGNLRYTAASQSMASFQHKCPDSLPCLDDDPMPKALERAAYFGGRSWSHYCGAIVPHGMVGVEGLAPRNGPGPVQGGGPVYCLDLCGAYPSVMRKNLYPKAYLRTERSLSPRRLRDYLYALGAVADVTVKTDRASYPLRSKEAVTWQTGTLRTALCGPELIEALDAGDVIEAHSANLYALGELFTSWVDWAWGERQKAQLAGDELGVALWKTVLVSLHGKYAQKGKGWILVKGAVASVPWGPDHVYDHGTGKVTRRRSIAWALQRQGEEKEAKDSFPAIAAYTTSYLRQRMRHLTALAGEREVYLEVVDALHVSQLGYDRLCRAGEVAVTELGRLRVEAQSPTATYWGPRHYQLGDKVVNAGLSSRARLILPGTYQQTKFARLDQILAGRPPPGPLASEEIVVPTSEPPRCSVGRDGWTTPLVARGERGYDLG